MSSRAIVIVVVLVVVGFTIMSLSEYFTREPEVVTSEVAEKQILVAKRNLTSGTFIDVMQDLDWAPEPVSENKTEASAENGENAEKPVIPVNYLYQDSVRVEDFGGAIVRRTVRAGEPITASMLMKSGEGGFMSAVLESGKRAVSISVNAISGNAGFVSPGDRVDLLVTYRVKNAGNDDLGIPESIGTETFVRNIRVLAVDQSLDNPENKAILANTITVEVTPEEAQKISVASELGKISVALVSAGASTNHTANNDNMPAVDMEKATGDSNNNSKNYTIDGDVSSFIEKKESSTNRVRVIRADKMETLEFYQDKK